MVIIHCATLFQLSFCFVYLQVKEFIKFMVVLALVITAYTVGMQSLINPNSNISNRTEVLNDVILPPYYYLFGSVEETFMTGDKRFIN